MAMDFSGSAGAATPFDLLPKGQLAWAILTVKGVKASAAGGGYLDCELTLCDDQPFARRKIFDMIGDPQNGGNSEKYREMGMIAITRILECGRGAGPNNLPGYQIENYQQLSGLKVAIKVGVEEGTGGHNDKNRVAEYLTPNPASQSGHKGFQALMRGEYGATGAKPAPAAAQGGFSGFGGAGATPAPAASGGFGFGGGGAASPAATGGFGNGGQAGAASGFQQPAGDAASSAAGQQQTTGFATTTPATAASPSDPTATPNWLAQAGQ